MTLRTSISPLSIIVGVDEFGGFGKDGKIPWNIPEDLKHFQKTTKDTICIMGRTTYEDMLQMVKARQKKKKKLKSVLAGRKCIVLTRDTKYKAEGADVYHSLMEAVQSIDADDKREVFVIGGEKLFIESLPSVNTIYMTVVKGEDGFDCDRFFPIDYVKSKFKIVDGTETDLCYYVTYTRALR